MRGFLAVALLVLAELASAAVALVTVGPGEVYWQRFGHNAIFVDYEDGAVNYNYGVFDFEQENFLLNFLRGQMRYQLAPLRAEADFQGYIASDRSVTVQQLNLSPEQEQRLRAYLHNNARPENREYLYNYFSDNCSTRVRDALDYAVDGQLRAQLEGRAAGHSYRDQVRRLTGPEAWLYAGTSLGLGRPADEPLDLWQAGFIPMTLAQSLAGLDNRWEDGSVHPLVSAPVGLHRTTSVTVLDAPPLTWPWFLAAGLLLAGGVAWAGRAGTATWWAMSGLLGWGMLMLWLFSDHTAAWQNENLLVFSPLAPALLLPWRAIRRTLIALLGASGATGLVLALLPGGQFSIEWVLLALPPLVVALRESHSNLTSSL